MKASVDDSRCRGHGVCTTICPQVFALTDDGYAEVIVDEVPESLADSALAAAFGTYPRRWTASITRSAVDAETWVVRPLRTFETVIGVTPASAATSLRVGTAWIPLLGLPARSGAATLLPAAEGSTVHRETRRTSPVLPLAL